MGAVHERALHEEGEEVNPPRVAVAVAGQHCAARAHGCHIVAAGTWSLIAAIAAPAQDTPAVEPPAATLTTNAIVSPLFAARAQRREQFRNPKVLAAVRNGIAWLLAHQDADGRWDADQFMKHDRTGKPCDGAGNAAYDPGLTGLALLALLAQADTACDDAITRGADWLVGCLNREGRIAKEAHDFVYSQAIATVALVEVTALLGHDRHRKAAAAALGYLQRHRNANAAWRYQQGDTDNDTSISSWCIAAYAAATHAGFSVPATDVGIALTWLDTATDSTGHCGYTRRGEPSARTSSEHATRFPTEFGIAMTAAGLHARLVSGLPPDAPLAIGAADIMTSHLPAWDAKTVDLYAWFHASTCMAMMPPSDASRTWNTALHKALLGSQRKEGHAAGSWDPIDVWGELSGRVGTTAFAVLSLSPYRLDRIDPGAGLPAQPPFRSVRDLVRTSRIGEAANVLARVDASEHAPAVAAAMARLRWYLDVATTHAERQLANIDELWPDANDRHRLLESICERFGGTALGTNAEEALRRLASDPAVQREAEANKELRPLQKAYAAWRAQPSAQKRRQLRDDLAKFIAKHAGTKAAATAQQWRDSM